MFLEDQLQKWLRSSREICKRLLFQRIQFFNWFHLFYLGYLVVTNKCLQTKLWKWNSLAQNLFFPSICWLVHSRTSTEHEQKIFRIPRTRTEQEPKKYACSFIPEPKYEFMIKHTGSAVKERNFSRRIFECTDVWAGMGKAKSRHDMDTAGLKEEIISLCISTEL